MIFRSDVFKLFALFFMLLDHFAYFIYPEASFLRVLGRLAAPLFFFAYGFSLASRDVTRPQSRFFFAAILVSSAVYLFRHDFFPLDVLFTFFAISLLPARSHISMSTNILPIFAFSFLTYFLTSDYLPYGFFPFAFFALGYSVLFNMPFSYHRYISISVFAYFIYQCSFFSYSPEYAFLITVAFYYIISIDFPYNSSKMGFWYRGFDLGKTLSCVSRNSLLLYIVHIVAFVFIHVFERFVL